MRRSAQRQRGKRTLPVKRIVLIGTEGRNKTEEGYFQNFNQIQNQFIVKFSSGNSTDAMGIVKDVKKSRDKKNIFDTMIWPLLSLMPIFGEHKAIKSKRHFTVLRGKI